MTSGLKVAIVGATGVVGNAFLRVLEQRRSQFVNFFLLASDRSHGQSLSFAEHEYSVTSVASFDWDEHKIDIAFFSAGNDISRRYAPIAREAGCIVIDNSSAFRYDADIPLIVPEVNGDDLSPKKGMIIANPNCSTLQMSLVLAPIYRAAGIKRVIVATYQAVSGAGQGLLDTLRESHSSLSSIHANVIPQIDVLEDNGYSREEMKMLWESRKILRIPDLLLSATAVRVPVENGHSQAVVIETSIPLSESEAYQCLESQRGLTVLKEGWVTPKEVSGQDNVVVSRVRQDLAFGETGLSCWIVGDNLLKGAALNAVQIAERLLDAVNFSFR
ncbi:MAG: aspartate-semialdehyde dehydrogenase [Gammaproteobacteria bacterium]|nr:aspartate-semialdehyde dehydrogenase [Gammaproteobacteria bacterium]